MAENEKLKKDLSIEEMEVRNSALLEKLKQETQKRLDLENKLNSAESKVSEVDELEHILKKVNKEIANLVAVKATVEGQPVRVTDLGQNEKRSL